MLDKKPGLTSFEALGEIKRALGSGKAGHTGTLDKFASGLLLVLAGDALKLTRWFTHCDKQYNGRIRFGIETDTLDPEGRETAQAAQPARSEVEKALSQFTGEIMQEPPVFSAIHVNGRRAHELARSGKEVEMKKRPVVIHKLELLDWQPPFADIFVHCSSGTYIRSLARDIALAAGSRAHLCALTRTKIAGFSLDDAFKGSFSENCLETADFLRPIDKTVIETLSLPLFEVQKSEAEKIIHGKPLEPILEGRDACLPEGNTSAAVFCGEKLAAIVEKADGRWKYGCVMTRSFTDGAGES